MKSAKFKGSVFALLMAMTITSAHAFRRPAPKPPTQAPESILDRELTNNTETGGSCEGNQTFHIGRGIYDVTGPAAELGMMGYAMLEQKTAGIHMRLRSRAFVIESPCNGKRVVFVSSDIGMIFQSVKQEVVRKLRARYGNTYGDANVILSATHTHNGPGGYSHYALYNLTILGFDKQNFGAITEGIFQAIVRANNNMRAGRIKINEGELLNASFNRSSKAYDRNPAAERARYSHNTDKTMTLLRLENSSGGQLGMINWFAVHPTNVGNKNRLITGDNKGIAAYLFEKSQNTNYGSTDTFVAAFAQANEGDVSPNLWGIPDNKNDYDRANTIAKRQYDKATALYNGARTQLRGGVDYRHAYVNFAYHSISGSYTDSGSKNTCAAAIGGSMVAGSTEDGTGLSFVSEGMVYDGASWPRFTLMPEEQRCQGNKPILLPTGKMWPYPWTPEILPVQIALVGDLAIIAVPFECTTMCGRRLRETVLDTLRGDGVRYAVIAGLSNAYAGYVATKEEYDVQHYEGASTHFGRWQLDLMRQEFGKLAEALRDDRAVDPGPTPRDLSGKQTTLQTGVVFDDVPLWKSFGDVKDNASSAYNRGQTVSVKFWGGHPKNDLRTQGTFLEVQRKSGSNWVTVARDGDPETRYQWARNGIAYSHITIKWTIPSNAPTGTYRIRHYGNWKSGWTGRISGYTGTSRSFSVR